jgi:Peptidase family M1 domain
MPPRVLLFLFSCFWPAFALAADSSPRELLASLNALGIDPQKVFTIAAKDRIEIRQPDIVIALEDGKLAFFQPFEGHVTGFVFSGVGHVLATPRDPVEKQQMARFLGAPLLDQQFVSAYFRFTNDAAEDLSAQLQRAGLTPVVDAAFAALWQPQVDRLNPSHSHRIVFEKFSGTPRHFFHAAMDGVRTGPFDILIDDMRGENLLMGQPRVVAKINFYDAWSSSKLPGFVPPSVAFDALHYQIETTIQPDNSLAGNALVEFRALQDSKRLLFIQLSRALKIENVSTGSGEPLDFFQNEGLTEQELRTRGDDTLCVFLPRPPKSGDTFSLRFRYHGKVISDAGNGVLFVNDRESWYPHYGGAGDFALFDMTIRWPKRLRLVATGDKISEDEDGEFRVGRWKTAQPVPEAGFNLGVYSSASITSENRSVSVFANQDLEKALFARLTQPSMIGDPWAGPTPESPGAHPSIQRIPPNPADGLRLLARQVDSSIRFYERYCGPFPFASLNVSQIPGTFGQGWPGLLYLSTFSFLPQEAQRRAGLTESDSELFSQIIPVHEVAHQWWGNVVGWSSYRDQWIDESIASYLALLFADSQNSAEQTLHAWLERDRRTLITKSPDSDRAPADIGPLIAGGRLSSSKSPEAYDQIVYAKGPWVIHMIREMLRQPNAPNSKDADARFIGLLQTLQKKYAHAPLSTEQFQREVEAVMTPKMALEGGRSMEWFFEQYVRGTGIPHYKVEYTSRRTEKGFVIRGKLTQTEVPRSFVASVPLYASTAPGHTVLLGNVLASGEETSFTFTSTSQPHKLLIDPRMTLLCVPE